MNGIESKWSAVSVVFCLFVLGMWIAYAARTQATPAKVFNIAEHLCKNNEGTKAISRNISDREWNIFCNNTAEFRAVVIELKKGEQLGSSADKANTN